MTDQAISKSANKHARKMAREPGMDDQNRAQEAKGKVAQPGSSPTKPPSKTSLILGMLRRAEGTTLEQMVLATGWLPHTTRAALTGLRKKGHIVTRSKVDGKTRYTVTAVPLQ